MSSEGVSLLAEARQALDGSAAWGGAWQRAAAFLGRQALETAVGDLWDGLAAGVGECSMAAQLVCLPFYMEDGEMARRVSACWCAIARAEDLAQQERRILGLRDGADLQQGRPRRVRIRRRRPGRRRPEAGRTAAGQVEMSSEGTSLLAEARQAVTLILMSWRRPWPN